MGEGHSTKEARHDQATGFATTGPAFGGQRRQQCSLADSLGGPAGVSQVGPVPLQGQDCVIHGCERDGDDGDERWGVFVAFAVQS
jgi:hypothetical protein